MHLSTKKKKRIPEFVLAWRYYLAFNLFYSLYDNIVASELVISLKLCLGSD